MQCPECGHRNDDEATSCAGCGATLGDAATGAAAAEHPKGPLVQVFRTADASLLPVIESVLLGEGIEFLVHGEEGQALFPLGSIGGGSDKRFLGAIVRVREDDAERAREVLAAMTADGEGDQPG